MTGFQSKRAMANNKVFDRFQAMEDLEDDDFQYIMTRDGGVEMLRTILCYGFSGYSNFTDEMLIDELKGRGLYEQGS
jgi:hypothetical protein